MHGFMLKSENISWKVLQGVDGLRQAKNASGDLVSQCDNSPMPAAMPRAIPTLRPVFLRGLPRPIRAESAGTTQIPVSEKCYRDCRVHQELYNLAIYWFGDTDSSLTFHRILTHLTEEGFVRPSPALGANAARILARYSLPFVSQFMV